MRHLLLMFIFACWAAPAVIAQGTKFDISGGGLPSMTGNLGGFVQGGNTITSTLALKVNFGDISPANTNRMVRVVVPISVRSTQAYQVTVATSGSTGNNADPEAFKLSDIGIGVQNFRRLGSKATICGANSIIRDPFNNDPATTADFSERVAYPSSLKDIGSSGAILISGPQLTQPAYGNDHGDNGWAFDLILTVAPQFYSPGNYNLMINLTIQPGPYVPCM